MAPTLVGRDAELQLLSDVTERASHGQGGCIAIVGEAGVGKTSLLDQWVGQLQRHGVAVHRAAATEVDQHRPFGVLRRALPNLVAGDDPVDGLLDHVERLAAGRPLAVLMDDLHWGDTLTIAALHSLVERSVELGLITACLSRQTPSSVALNGLMDRIDQLGWRRRLAPLDDCGLTELVEARFGSSCGPRLAEALETTAGNPFLIQEYLSGLCEDGLLNDDGSVIDLTSSDSLPGSLAFGLSARAHAAVPGGELVVDAMAALPDGTSPDEIAGVLDLPTGTVIRHCLAATTAGVIVEREGQIGFRHDLIRQAVAARTPATVRTAIARQAGDLLAEQGADPGRIAACWLAGCEWTEAHISRIVELGRLFCHDHPFAAIALLEPAVDRMRPDDRQLGQVVLDLGWALVAAGRAADVESLLAGRLLDTLGADPTALEELRTLAQALHGGLHATVESLEGIDDAALARLDPLAAEPSAVDRAAGLALILAVVGRLPTAKKITDLVAAAPSDGGPYRAAFHESAQAWIAVGAGRFESAGDHARRARAAAIADPVRRLGVAVPAGVLAVAAGHLGHLDEAGSTIADALAQTRQPRWGVPLLHAYQSMIHYRAGRWDDTLTELDAARGAASDADLHLDAFFPIGALSTLIGNARGDMEGVNQASGPEGTIAGNPTSIGTRGSCGPMASSPRPPTSSPP
ncbi:MAG: AAA family ATPase [Acidimicrobiia bacterium]|nr:AAA family ATPase [Acidimicrobiia bacterium]